MQIAVDTHSKEWNIIAEKLHKSKRIIFITGAGISVSGGIPDFRSSDGLYDLVKQRYPDLVCKGKDLFSASLFKDKRQTSLFYSFMAALKKTSDTACVTKTHQFIKKMSDWNKLLRCYTQNIDDLDDRAGLYSGFDSKANVVKMHGDLNTVKCTLCSHSQESDTSILSIFDSGEAPACPRCFEIASNREKLGKRAVNIGTLRPNIVLYDEHHAKGELIADLQNSDLKKKPDVLIVMGTSLKIVGVKRLIKAFAEPIKEKGGFVLYVNMNEASKEWESTFNYQLIGTSDSACEKLWKRMDELQEIQTQNKIKREKQKEQRLLKKEREMAVVSSIENHFKAVKCTPMLILDVEAIKKESDKSKFDFSNHTATLEEITNKLKV
ncbi:hypothetical protein HDV04_002601 [Boothiomyces sp. JEL0838]|nr:hypothetical protein HDV04_002601 [Boothiomyces sp. JEL0838]